MPIPYIFHSSIGETLFLYLKAVVCTADSTTRGLIRNAVEGWSSHTCLSFQEYSSAPRKNYIEFFRGSG